MRYYIIVGEASGDLHASNLIKALKIKDSKAVVRGWGGDLMAEAGVEIVKHYKDTAIMGFFTVLKKLKTIGENIKACHKDILAWRPDVVIMVDYGGFNLRLAKLLHRSGIPLFYYISPKIWAWDTGRVRKIKRLIDRMFVIFPFEVDFYKRYNYKVYYGGNPLVDAVESRNFKEESFKEFIEVNRLPEKPIVALVPGSRKQELKHVLPKMLEMTNHFPNYQFVIAGAPSMQENDYADYLNGRDIKIVFGMTYRLVNQARVALVTSGTATLETAILETPQVVCYSGEGGAFSYFMFKLFVKVRYISLVNLIVGREVVPELLMQKLNKKNLLKAMSVIIDDGKARQQMMIDYKEVKEKLGKTGVSERVAAMMLDELKK